MASIYQVLIVFGLVTIEADAAVHVRRHEFSEEGATKDHIEISGNSADSTSNQSPGLVRGLLEEKRMDVDAAGNVEISDHFVDSTGTQSTSLVRDAKRSKKMEVDAGGNVVEPTNTQASILVRDAKENKASELGAEGKDQNLEAFDVVDDQDTAIKAAPSLMRAAADADSDDESLSVSTCGVGEEVDDTNCLAAASLQKSQALATAYMSVGGKCCTAWLVKAATSKKGALMLSTGHCGALNSQATFYFNYVQSSCSAAHRRRSAPRTDSCIGTRKSLESYKDEQTIYELEKPCAHADAATPILLDVGKPVVGEQMYIIGHPNCRPQLISYEEQHDDGSHCVVKNEFSRRGSRRVGYYCDTQGGNSGSPVFSSRTGRAFAIHSHGGCTGRNKRNSGGLLANVKNHLDKFSIPYVNRSSEIFSYHLMSRQNSLCLNEDSNNNNVNTRSCGDHGRQKWHFDGEHLKNSQSSKCLDYESSSNNVIARACDSGDNSHKWFFNGKQLKSKESDARCLAISSQNVAMKPCDNSDGQKWYFATLPPLQYLGASGCTSSNKCNACQGDCDSDSDCASGMICFQRNGRETIPLCTSGGGGDKNGYDYCTTLPPLQELGWAGCTSSNRCSECQGDCDSDSDCASGLTCFQRSGHESVPSCASGGGGDSSGYDYCTKGRSR